METKITLVNGEEITVSASVEQVIEEMTTDLGNVYNGYTSVADGIYIFNAHIIKIEQI